MLDGTGDALLVLAGSIYAKSTQINARSTPNQRQIDDDPYNQRVTHVPASKTKTLDLVAYREYDRNIVKVTDKDEDDRIPAMTALGFIEENGFFPTRDGSIKLGVDEVNHTVIILLRLTRAINMPVGSYPEYVKFICQFNYFSDAKKFHHENWPTFVCGCDSRH